MEMNTIENIKSLHMKNPSILQRKVWEGGKGDAAT